jgi:quinol monooxygenase YgiN
MIILAGYSLTGEEARDAAVTAFAGLVERARQQDGCLDFSIGADPVDPERINLFECWRDQAALAAWRKVARGPRVRLRDSRVHRYHTEKAERPF